MPHSVIPHNRPTLGRAETEAARRVIESGWLAQGKEVERFENEVCAYHGLADGHAVALSSGTAALFMALWALTATGRRVAIPAYSCAALRNAVLMAGGHPVAVDVAKDSPNVDSAKIVRENADIAIIAHMFGIPCRIDGGSGSMPIIEDCAQAFGARIDGELVGLAGKVGVFSFYASKTITSGGQGGMLMSREKSLVDQVRDYRDFDCRRDRKPRFNFQMTDLQAALGRAQLARVDDFLHRRRHLYRIYADHALPLWPSRQPPDTEPSRYRAILRVPDPQRLIATLNLAQVRSIVPIEEWELLDTPERLPNARQLTCSTVSIPIYPSLADSEATRIADLVSSALLQPD